MLCILGAIAGLVFGELLLRILLHTGFGSSALAFPIGEWSVAVGIALSLALLSGLVFALAGLYFIRRQDLAQALREGDARSSGGTKEHRIRAGLVVTQLVLACVLTGVGAMLAHSLMKLGKVNLGFQPEHVITFQVDLPVDRPSSGTHFAIAGVLSQIQGGLAQAPGANAVTVASDVPFDGGSEWESAFPYPWDHQHTPIIVPVLTDGSYFKTLGIRLLAGREFSPTEAAPPQALAYGSPQATDAWAGVAVLDTTAARQIFGTTKVIGREFNFDGPNRTRLGFFYKVIGLVGSVHRTQVERLPRRGTVYLDRDQLLSIKDSLFAQSSWYVVVRTPLATNALLPTLSQAVARIAPNASLYDVRSMGARLSNQLAPRRGLMTLVLMFALGALLLAAVGLYAVQSYSVSQRLHEFGIRAALGADRNKLLTQVMREIAKLLVIGLIIGLMGVVLLGHVFSAALYDVTFADPVSLFLVFVILSFTALTAGWVPAWRASRVPPVVALRQE